MLREVALTSEGQAPLFYILVSSAVIFTTSRHNSTSLRLLLISGGSLPSELLSVSDIDESLRVIRSGPTVLREVAPTELRCFPSTVI